MDGHTPPHDILDEIFQKSGRAPSPPQAAPSKEDAPPPAPPEPELPGLSGPSGERQGAKPWLCALLGGTLLVLAVCVFQLVWTGARLDELQGAVENIAAIDALQEKNESLQKELDEAKDLIDQCQQQLDEAYDGQSVTQVHRKRADYLFYIGQFLAHGDYEMAALVVAEFAEEVFGNYYVNGQLVPVNPEHMTLYTSYRDQLVKEGYLRPVYKLSSSSIPDYYTYAEGYDPQKPELFLLWRELEEYYILDSPHTAASFIIKYQDRGYEKKVSQYTAGLYRDMIQDMGERLEYLCINEDGTLGYLYGGLFVEYGESVAIPWEPAAPDSTDANETD